MKERRKQELLTAENFKTIQSDATESIVKKINENKNKEEERKQLLNKLNKLKEEIINLQITILNLNDEISIYDREIKVSSKFLGKVKYYYSSGKEKYIDKDLRKIKNNNKKKVNNFKLLKEDSFRCVQLKETDFIIKNTEENRSRKEKVEEIKKELEIFKKTYNSLKKDLDSVLAIISSNNKEMKKIQKFSKKATACYCSENNYLIDMDNKKIKLKRKEIKTN